MHFRGFIKIFFVKKFLGYDSTVLEVAFRRQKGLEFDEETTKFLNSLPESVIVMEGNYVADEQLQNINAIYWKEDTFQVFLKNFVNM